MNLTAKQHLSRNPSNAGYATPLKTYSVPATENQDGTINVPAQPVYPIDPNYEPIIARMPSVIVGDNQSGTNPPTVQRSASVVEFNGGIAQSGFVAGGGNLLTVMALQEIFKGGIGGEAVRTPTTFVHALCTTVAATVVWDPAAGKKFRLMGYVIVPAAGMAAAGIQLITLLDEATAITIAHQVYLPAAANVTNQPPIVVKLAGNGYLSVAADNRLSVTLTSACTAGAISVMAYGTEE